MKFLEKSLEISRQLAINSEERFAHFAFLFERNKLLSIGINNTKQTNAKVKYFGQKFGVDGFVKWNFPHAEIDVISRLWGRRHITGRENLVVLRIGRKGQLLPSRPCQKCSPILIALGFTKVFYSVEDEIISGVI